MTLIVDASVALKWVMSEDGTDRARSLLLSEALAAPDLMWIECANVLWVKARRGQIGAEDARAACAAIEATPVQRLAVAALSARALEIAFALDHPAHDCLYLAAALEERAVLVTADAAFLAKAAARGAYGDQVRAL